MLAAGMSNQGIAGQLVVSLDTVKKHVSHVLGKLGAASRTEAVARARQLGLIPSAVPASPGHGRCPRAGTMVPAAAAEDSTACALSGDGPARGPLIACR